MGHREDLLEGAKKCLLEIGYANTTARDIVAASGTNLASIGYHFGSKEALMTQAIIELLGLGREVRAAADRDRPRLSRPLPPRLVDTDRLDRLRSRPGAREL